MDAPPLSFSGRRGASVPALMAEVTTADVARRLGVPPSTLRRWVRMGLLGHVEAALKRFSAPTERFVARQADP